MTRNRNDLLRNLDAPSLLDDEYRDFVKIALPSLLAEKDAVRIVGKLSQTCHSFYTSLQLDREKQATKQLLQYVLQGNPAKAKKIYSANPRLMFIEATCEAYAAGVDENGKAIHRVIVESPYRAALGEGDVEIYNDMANYFYQVFDEASGKNGYELAKEQLAQQFPNGFDYPKSTYDFSALMNAIKRDNQLTLTSRPSAATENLIAQFRKDFLPSVVKSGHHFNLNELIRASEVYDQNLYDSHWSQLILFWCQVIGFLERLVSAYDAQVLRQGNANIMQGKKPLSRNFELLNYKNEEKISYFPLDENPTCRLGFDFGVDRHLAVPLRAKDNCVALFTKLMLNKKNKFNELIHQPSPSARRSRCIIC